MPGFDNQTGSPDDLTVVFADNACWNGTERGELMNTNGQLWIGSTTTPHVRRGTLTAGAGITITPGAGTIEIAAAGGAMAIDQIALQAGTSPIGPDGTGLITFNGTSVAQGTIPVQTRGTGANTMRLEVQTASAAAATDATIIGLAAFESSQFTVDANGFVSLVGGANLPAIQTLTGDDGTVVGPNASGNIDLDGIIVANAANSKPLFFDNEAANVLRAELQVATERTGAPANSNDAGICSFDDTEFTVDANGFVQLSTTGAGQTITGDSGGALSPTSGNWNILGGPGVTTSGSGSTLTINSVVFTDTTATTMAVDNGYFATAAGTYNLPATAAQGELIHIIADTAGAVVVDAPAGDFIRIGNVISADGGTATSNAIGDSLTLRFRSSSQTWIATAVQGTWTIA